MERQVRGQGPTHLLHVAEVADAADNEKGSGTVQAGADLIQEESDCGPNYAFP